MKLRLALLLFPALLAFSFAASGQYKEWENIPVVDRKPDGFFNTDFGKPIRLDTFFWNLFESTATPAGIAFAKNEDIYSEKYEFHPDGPALKDILSSFTRASGYSWNERDGVVNVLPAQDYSVLNIRIRKFDAENEYPWDVRNKLIETPEFQKYLKEGNLIDRVPDSANKNGFIITGPFGRPNPRLKISFNLANASVREILNEILRKRSFGTWSYREYDLVDDGSFYSMYRLEL